MSVVVLILVAFSQETFAKEVVVNDKKFEFSQDEKEIFKVGFSELGIYNETIENMSGLIVEPFDVDPGDGIRYCSGTFNSYLNSDSYVTIQTNTSSVNRSIQWAFFIRPSAYSKYQPEVTVRLTDATVNGVKINRPYEAHTESPSYNFHGSMKNYQVAGTNKALQSNDIIEFFFRAHGYGVDSGTTAVSLKCRVN